MGRKESSRVLIVEKEQEGGCDAGLKGTLKCSESGASDQTLLLVATCRHITHSRCLWLSDAISYRCAEGSRCRWSTIIMFRREVKANVYAELPSRLL